MKIKQNEKIIYETDSVKYLGFEIDKRIPWKQQISHVALKLNKGNDMFSTLRHVLDIEIVRSICYAIFQSHQYYVSLV